MNHFLLPCFAAFCAMTFASCHKPLTEVIVVIDADDVSKPKISSLEISLQNKTLKMVAPDELRFPVTFTVVSSDPGATGLVKVIGRYKSEFANLGTEIKQLKAFSFVAQERRAIKITLLEQCLTSFAMCSEPALTCDERATPQRRCYPTTDENYNSMQLLPVTEDFPQKPVDPSTMQTMEMDAENTNMP